MERFKKALLIAASSLLFCFPVYADEPEAADLPIEEVNHNVELISDSNKEASDIPIENLAEIQGGMLRSPSINPSAEFEFLGFTIIDNGNNTFSLDMEFLGSIDTTIYRDRFDVAPLGKWASAPSYISEPYDYGTTITNIYLKGLDGTNHNVWSGRLTVESNMAGDYIGENDLQITSYLSFVGTVFTWLLATIGTLIGFILGNPFLAVSLLLFMAGTVISFYIRIKNS